MTQRLAAQARRVVAAAASVLLVACAGYGGAGLVAGVASHDDVLRLMGPPALQWVEPDGSRLLAFPRAPAGVHTWMVRIGADGKLASIENAMDQPAFARVTAGMDGEAVLKVLGPPLPEWTAYFKARDELVWGWRYCNDWNQLARFFVLFDGTTRKVRSTMSLREEYSGSPWSHHGSYGCSR